MALLRWSSYNSEASITTLLLSDLPLKAPGLRIPARSQKIDNGDEKKERELHGR